MDNICEKLIKYRLNNSFQRENYMHVACFLLGQKKWCEKVG